MPRAGAPRVRPPHPGGRAAQPRRARGPPHRRAAGPPGHLARRPRPGRGFAEAVGAVERAVDARGRRRRDDRGRRVRGPPRDGGDRRGADRRGRGPRFRISAPRRSSRRTRRWPSACTASAVEFAALQGWERVYDLFCGIGTIGLALAPARGRGVGPRDRRGGDRRRDRQRARATTSRNARFFAGDVRLALRELVERAGRPDVLVVDPPRAGLSAKIVRRIIEAGAEARSSTSRATRRRSRRTPPSSSRRARRCGACARSTCSRRRRTSSASRCSSGRRFDAPLNDRAPRPMTGP